MSNINTKQRQLAKITKAAKACAWLVVFGGAALIVWGIATMYLPTVLNGVTLGVSSLLLFVVSAYARKKLDALDV